MRQLILTGLSLSILFGAPSLAVAQVRSQHLLAESVQAQSVDNNIDALIEQAEAAAANEDYVQAERLWRQVMTQPFGAENPTVFRGLSIALTQQEEFTEAETILRELVRLEPEVAMNHSLLGEMLLAKAIGENSFSPLAFELDEIEFHFEEAIRLEPDQLVFRKMLTIVLHK